MTSYKDAVKEIYAAALRAQDSALKDEIRVLCTQTLTTDAPPVEALVTRQELLLRVLNAFVKKAVHSTKQVDGHSMECEFADEIVAARALGVRS